MGEVVNSDESPTIEIKENGINGNENAESVVSKKMHDELGDNGIEGSESPKIATVDDDEEDEEEEDEPMETDEDHVNGGGADGGGESGQISLADTEEDDENSKNPMEIDDDSTVPPSQNGHHASENGDSHDSEDLDKPVSINSDSDNEEEVSQRVADDVNSIDLTPATTNDVSNSSKTNGAKDDDIQEILSDKEDDCVVVEDDDDSSTPAAKKAEEVSPRRSGRARKSLVSVRDYASFDDDDDIEEIIDDPLSVSAKKRPGLQISPAIRGQTTITPSKAMANAAAAAVNNNNSSNNTAKDSSMVIIDTNTLINNARSNNTTINLTTSPPKGQQQQNPNPFSVVPVGISATSAFNQSPKTPKAPPPLQPVSTPTLLPALTDDMFVLEAPSFIVPYIYEKPPKDNLKDVVGELEKVVAEMRAKYEKELQERRDRGEVVDEDETSQTSSTNDKPEPAPKPPTPPVVEEQRSQRSERKRKRRPGDDDYDWDEYGTSTDEEASDSEARTKVLIKEVKEDIDTIKEHIITPETAKLAATQTVDAAKKSDNYFENPLGKFFMNIGLNLVQEYVQTDLLRQQKRKKDKDGAHPPAVQMAINSLKKNLEVSKENNKPFKHEMKRCEFCPFKTESSLAMAHHYETPHLRSYIYKCNFCDYETRPPHEILYHMEAVHNIKGKLEKALSYHQCPNCPFEDNGKSKLARHQVSCVKKFKPESNLCPPLDWEPPAKIPRIKPKHGLVGTATAYQAMAAQQQRNVFTQNKPAQATQLSIAAVQAAALRARGRPQTVTQAGLGGTVLRQGGTNAATAAALAAAGGMMLSKNYQQLAASAMAAAGSKFLQNATGMKSNKQAQQPSISITPLPRQSGQSSSGLSVASALSKIQGQGTSVKPGQTSNASGKTSFVVCEICDGYIKDLDQLRNHMQWIHKVKIHPKMIYNRPPLNCQKCQYRFFTDQGLERHLLGSHGLVTSSMQEAANKGKDAGRCPVCGRVYQWKLLNHVSRDHNMTLKPAHLSYKCTVCTATFGMYKQFESHVYSAHSTVAKKALDNKNKGSGSSKSGGDSLLKPLKINDEITIIPQPASKTKTIEIE